MGKENKNDLRNKKRNKQKHTTASQPCDQSERLKKIQSLLEEIQAEDEDAAILVAIVPSKGNIECGVSGSPIMLAASIVYLMKHVPEFDEVVKAAVYVCENAK